MLFKNENELIKNLNEIKGALENLTDKDLIENRINLLELIEECLEFKNL